MTAGALGVVNGAIEVADGTTVALPGMDVVTAEALAGLDVGAGVDVDDGVAAGTVGTIGTIVVAVGARPEDGTLGVADGTAIVAGIVGVAADGLAVAIAATAAQAMSLRTRGPTSMSPSSRCIWPRTA